MARKKKNEEIKNLADLPPDVEAVDPPAEGVADSTGTLKQTFIPGAEPLSIPKLDELLATYDSLKTPWQHALKQFVEKGKKPLLFHVEELLADGTLKKNEKGEIIYNNGHQKMVLKPKTATLKVSDVGDDEEGEEVEVDSAPADNTEGD